ncbi:MAG: DUF4870 domain-containing protein [Bacteroidia bacterium]|nr:DUF4870 domain-containing protein [Bacteroidia bacterium]
MDRPTISYEEAEARRRADDAKTWGMLCHLAVFAGFLVPFGNIFGPLTVWLMKRDSIPEVMEHGKESLNFQISITLYSIVGVVVVIAALLGSAAQSVTGDPDVEVLLFTGAWILGFLLIAVLELIFVIVATVRASRRESYRYPLSIRFIS